MMTPKLPPCALNQGHVVTLPSVYSPELGNTRPLYVYLPRGYEEGTRRYPVFYLQDGQNLFDPALSHCGSWHLHQVMDHAPEEEQGILVGIPNAGAERCHEYAPFHDPRFGGGKAEAYLDFLVRRVKPIVDETFRTLPSREHTLLGGSSMGALLSLTGFLRRPEVFGRALVMSPSAWFAGRSILVEVEKTPVAHPGGLLYVDTGTEEGFRSLEDMRLLDEALRKKSLPGRYVYHEEEGASHTEDAWGRRFRNALGLLHTPF